ncbi:DUF479 domain-containing protein [Alteromonas aestuariivivens]|uniref:DUF479 domain-containing protein n=1 Tax=Alteromonas aestuariivivens TaxID=1938339 RepID=A0A3D8MCV9_9ALTE|nr:ACP phosphodiesterase [Alteromonas aestuariivivens]RDV28069.1 DUF479 domain-containing protein [Alteromonas aestuariivivens]
MNYLAHLFLAQPHADSHFGNLLGDFRRGADIQHYPDAVLAGLQNHYLVDRFTDAHPLVRRAKQEFSTERRRFAGIALDVLFDYYLIKHWSHFSDIPFEKFCYQAYMFLDWKIPQMPQRMQRVVSNMIEYHWFETYQSLDGIGLALDRIATRIRFEHQFEGCVEEIIQNYSFFEECFVDFFPELITHVRENSPETKC